MLGLLNQKGQREPIRLYYLLILCVVLTSQICSTPDKEVFQTSTLVSLSFYCMTRTG